MYALKGGGWGEGGGVSNQLLKTINFRVQERLEKYCKGRGRGGRGEGIDLRNNA